MGLDRCFLEPDGCSPRSCVGAIASRKAEKTVLRPEISKSGRKTGNSAFLFAPWGCQSTSACRIDMRAPFDVLDRVSRARQPARIDPRSSRIIASFASLALIACRPSRSAACAMRLSVHSRPRYRPISAAREARGCVADLCESHARGCSIVRPSAAAGACGSRSTCRVRPVCGCLARAIRVFRPSTRCVTPAGPATCAYSTFCMRVGCSFIVPVRMLRGI